MTSKNKTYNEKDWIKDFGGAYGIKEGSSYNPTPKRKKSIVSPQEKEWMKTNPWTNGGKKRRTKSRKRKKSRRRRKSRRRKR